MLIIRNRKEEERRTKEKRKKKEKKKNEEEKKNQFLKLTHLKNLYNHLSTPQQVIYLDLEEN